MANQAQELLALVERFKVKNVDTASSRTAGQKKLHLSMNEQRKPDVHTKEDKTKIHKLAATVQGPAGKSPTQKSPDFATVMKDEGFEEF